jgi:hypothetical protein
VSERSNAGVARALKDGFARVASAPAVAIGMFGVLRVLDLAPEDDWITIGLGARKTIVPLLFWAFAYGGLLDRYARDRPTRAHGFFAACGAHFMPLARLALVPLLVAYGMRALEPGFIIGSAIVVVVDVTMQFARVRLVVEDRRSAIGSLLAGMRFVSRNAGSVAVLWIAYGLLHVGLGTAYQKLTTSPPVHLWVQRVIDETFFALSLWQRTLFPSATGLSLFQSRLAHAGYTAAPPAVWPESASAEAIANAAPRIAP